MDPKDITYRIAGAYVAEKSQDGDLDGPTSARIRGWIRARAYQRLANSVELLGGRSNNPLAFLALRQVEAFFKKNAAFTVEEVAFAAASKSFFDSEEQCRGTNLRLMAYDMDPGLYPEFHAQVQSMRTFIKKVLGKAESLTAELPLLTRVTPGATATRSRKLSRPHLKVRKRMVCTKSRAVLAGSVPLLRLRGIEIQVLRS
jgi:hypothetical protein